MHLSYVGWDAKLGIHLHDVWSVIKRSDDVCGFDVCVGKQRLKLFLFQLDAWAVVVHVAHHQQLVTNAMTLEPLESCGLVQDRSGREDHDVAARVDVQVVVVRIVEPTQRVVVVVAVQRIGNAPVDARDAPAVVGDAVVNV